MPPTLLELCTHAGCAAKVNPIKLDAFLHDLNELNQQNNSNILFPSSVWEDVGGYLLSQTECALMNVDIISPVIDDPFIFGEVAVAHALSDIYAKGANPLFSMNILAFPSSNASPEMAQNILRGMLSKLKEANTVMLGGHTVEDAEPKLGLAVVAFCEPASVIKNSGAKPGDKIVLTKKIGTGVLSTALKHYPQKLSHQTIKDVSSSMQTLNRQSANIMRKVGVSSCTDVTGFGLAGHLYTMLRASKVSARINLETVTFFDQTLELIQNGILPQNLHHNMDYLTLKIPAIKTDHPEITNSSAFEAFFDPQTSGGLLMSVPHEKCGELLADLHNISIEANVIGEIEDSETEEKIFVHR